MNLSLCTIVAIAIAACVPPCTAVAADWYVAPTGNDGNPGTRAAPFASVMAAQAAASGGDTVYLRGGTYRLTNANISVVRQPYAVVNEITKPGIAYVN
ncbi:DUF1565 domain-containing protein, partial [Xanthomonas euvesicatoria]|nr:DUF1565 domain-containing protein [Xanthomonas campestris pv. obscurae]